MYTEISYMAFSLEASWPKCSMHFPFPPSMPLVRPHHSALLNHPTNSRSSLLSRLIPYDQFRLQIFRRFLGLPTFLLPVVVQSSNLYGIWSRFTFRAGVAQSAQCLTMDWTTRVRSPTEAEDFSSSPCVQTGYGANRTSCPLGTGGLFSGGKARPRHDADHSPLSSAEVVNE
jgi:hypothetical protein